MSNSGYYQPHQQGHAYQPPPGPPPIPKQNPDQPPTALDRADFVSDADFEKMVASGEFGEEMKREHLQASAPKGYDNYDPSSRPTYQQPAPRPISGAGGFPEPPGFGDGNPGYRRPSPSAPPVRSRPTSGLGLGEQPPPEGHAHAHLHHPSQYQDDYIGEPGPPPVPQSQSQDFGFPEGPGSDPNIAARRGGYSGGAGRGGFPDPGAGRGGYAAGEEEYYEQPYDSYPGAGFGRGEGAFGRGRLGPGRGEFGDGFGREGGFERGRFGFGRDGFGGGFGRGEPGFGRGYPDEYGYAPGPGRGGFGRGGGYGEEGYGRGGYGRGGFGREEYGRGRGGAGYGGDAYGEGYGEEGYGGPAYGVRPPQAHPYAHLPELASVHDEYTDPELFHQAAERLHYTQQQQQQQPQKPQPPADFPPSKEQVKAEPAAPVGGGGKYDTFESHFANHAQAYGPDADHTAPMDTDAIGSAAAVEALKMSAAQNQAQSHPPAPHAPSQPQSPPAPSKPAAPQSHPVSSKPAANPSASPAPHKPQPSRPPPPKQDDDDEEEEEKSGGGGGGSAQDKIMAMAMGKLSGLGGAGGSGGSHASADPQDKIVALAMAQAGKLFDKKNGTGGGAGNQAAKVDAMHSAAATAMRLCGQYKTTGKVNLQPGEVQNLMGAAMSLLSK